MTDQELDRLLYAHAGAARDLVPVSYTHLVCWTVLAFGTLCGLLMVESRVWRGIVVALAAMVMTAALIFLMVMAAGPKIPLWGDLPYILGGVLAVVLAVSEFFLWRRITRFSVR